MGISEQGDGVPWGNGSSSARVTESPFCGVYFTSLFCGNEFNLLHEHSVRNPLDTEKQEKEVKAHEQSVRNRSLRHKEKQEKGVKSLRTYIAHRQQIMSLDDLCNQSLAS